MNYPEIFALVGNTPNLRLRAPQLRNVELYLKLEGQNPTGSVKDRACVELIRQAETDGHLEAGKTLLDSSSGNMACSIAFYGHCLGFPVRVISSSKLTAEKRDFIRCFKASLDIMGEFTIEGSRACQELSRTEPERYCFLDQLHNWANPRAHFETTGPEIERDFPEVAMIVGSLGSGGSMSGIARYFKQRRPEVRIVVVQAASGTRLPGTGAFDDGDFVTPFIRQAFDQGWFDHTCKIHHAEAVRRFQEIRSQGVFCGLQTSGIFHAALDAARELEVAGQVVLLSGDSGWKNLDKLIAVS